MKLKSSSSLSEPEMRAKLLTQVREGNLKSIHINHSSFKRSVHSASVCSGKQGISAMMQWSQPPKKEAMRKEAAPGECAQTNT